MTSLDPLLQKIFEEALHLSASDIHLEPTARGLQLRWRIGGDLERGPILPHNLQDAVVGKLKLLARVDGRHEGKPQDGSFVWRGTQVRLSAIPVLGGQSVVLRLFPQVSRLEQLDGLGIPPDLLSALKVALGASQGLVIIAAPTGNGKTTTFYASLRHIDPSRQKIITVEDPVEQRLPGLCRCLYAQSSAFSRRYVVFCVTPPMSLV
jgi:MSHA biogenesis protein MshE